jgi:2-polyprenyl-3-methyl-5-hydroxy-6-metoxy-1,4-benzoquinol methylase
LTNAVPVGYIARMEQASEIQCIFCGIPSDEIVIRENGYVGRRCPRCLLIYVSPRPSMESIANLYGHDEAHVPAAAHIAAAGSKRKQARHHLQLIRRWVRKGTLLEIGAGAGYFLDEARQRGFIPYAIEFNGEQASFIESNLGIPCATSSLSDGAFGDQRFDAIYHCDVLSHFYDPFEELRTAHSRLSEGGHLVFETGDLGDIRHCSKFERFQYPDHLFFFTRDNLRALLALSGFELVAEFRWSIVPQLALTRTVRRAKRFAAKLRNGRRRAKPSSTARTITHIANRKGATAQRSGAAKAAGDFARAAYMSFSQHVRYGLGAVWPHGDGPCTVLIVAKKLAPH